MLTLSTKQVTYLQYFNITIIATYRVNHLHYILLLRITMWTLWSYLLNQMQTSIPEIGYSYTLLNAQMMNIPFVFNIYSLTIFVLRT